MAGCCGFLGSTPISCMSAMARLRSTVQGSGPVPVDLTASISARRDRYPTAPETRTLAKVRFRNGSGLFAVLEPGRTNGCQANQQVIGDQCDGRMHHDENSHGISGLAEGQDIDI